MDNCTTTEPPVLDRDTIDTLREMLEETLDEVILEFVEQAPGQLTQLREAAACDDQAELVAVAHAMKGASGNLGIAALAYACQALETLAAQGAAHDPAAQVERIAAEFARAHRALHEFSRG